METRKIIIVDSATNQKVVINTDATTFGELKTAARAAGINYEDKDWLEGLTKTSPASDDSILPTNVPYKGTITNNLVYMLTNTNKKIRSGVDRKELYLRIKNLGLTDKVKETFGKNYTQVSNSNLESIIASAKDSETEVSENLGSYKAKYEEIVTMFGKFLASVSKDTLKDIEKVFDDSVATDLLFSDEDLDNLFKNC